MRWLARRIAWSALVVWAVVSITFAVNLAIPGDPARMVAGAQAREVDVARIRVQMGLGDPPLAQYARFWRRLVHLGPRTVDQQKEGPHATCAVVLPLGTEALHIDFGKSFQKSQPVVRLLAVRAPRTVALTIAGMFVQLLLGVSTGVLAALRRGSWLDPWLVGSSLLGISVPTFLLALVLQTLFAKELGWLPLDGFGRTAGEHLRCLVLPALTLGIFGTAYYTRFVRDEAAVLLQRDWVRTARAKGLSGTRVVIRHVLRNALAPIATAVGLDLGTLMGGAVVTETVFRWPGLGELSVKAAVDRDGPTLLACVVVTSVAVVASNLLVDVVFSRLDPSSR